MEGKIHHTRLAYCMRKCRTEGSIELTRTGLKHWSISGILILTACNVAVNTSFIGTLRLSSFLVYAALMVIIRWRKSTSAQVIESSSEARNPLCQAVSISGRSWGPQWASNPVSSSGLRIRMRPLFSRPKRIFLRGGLVEPPRPAQPAGLDSGPAAALAPTCAGPPCPRAPSGRVLWAVTRCHTGHAPPLGGRSSGQCGDDAVSCVADGTVGGGRENGTPDGGGPCLVARQRCRTAVAAGAQPSCQAAWRRACSRVPRAAQASLAQSARADMGAWQASQCRTCTDVAC